MTRADNWKSRANTAIGKFKLADDGTETVAAYAFMAAAVGRISGWTNAQTVTYLNKTYSLANPNGGYGLGYEYDAFQDGSLNPADTSYTVTMAGHVGPVLLEGYKAGAVAKSKVQTIVNLLMSIPAFVYPKGRCISYSNSDHDTVTGLNVHNVNSGTAWFLQEANAVGIGATGLQKLVVDIALHEIDAYINTTMWWPYMNSSDLQDSDHNSYSAEAMYRLAYPIGREAVFNHLNNELPDNEMSPISHMRLVSLPGGPGSMSRTTPTITLWAEMGDRWLAETSTFIANPPASVGFRLAQAAYYCSANWKACL